MMTGSSQDERQHHPKNRSPGGVLLKWTNYMSGWQPRFFEIRDGTLLYYKSKGERSAGCRGSIALRSASVQLTEDVGACEFTVRVSDDIVWFLKADTPVGRERWVRRLTSDSDSDYSSTAGHSRTPSVASSTVSHDVGNAALIGGYHPSASAPTTSRREELISERIVELGGYRELCEAQMTEIVQELEKVLSPGVESPPGAPALTRTKLLTLKATHIAMLSNVDRIMQLASESAEYPGVHRRTSSSTAAALSTASTPVSRDMPHPVDPDRNGAPSPSGTLTAVQSDDEGECWHDAIEKDGDSATRAPLTPPSTPADGPRANGEIVEPERATAGSASTPNDVKKHLPFGSFDSVAFPADNHYAGEVNHLTNEQLDYALTGAHDPAMWNLFASDGEMKMFKREVELDGLPVDPLKAHHSVNGCTALEYLHYFFDARYKTAWDHTLDDMKVIERISADLVVIHQKHKTVWPAAPRESLFWSHLRKVDEWKSPNAHDCYIVCNKDVKRTDVPLTSSSAVRVGLTVSMICETHIDNPKGLPLSELPRSAFTCKIIYVSSVHPGGWVPTSALRHVYKREYPKFLRTFTKFVLDKVKTEALVAI